MAHRPPRRRLPAERAHPRFLRYCGFGADLTGAASRVYADFFLPFEAYLFAAAIYLCITFALIGASKLLERRFLGYLAPRKH